jgi:Helix-turn-helix
MARYELIADNHLLNYEFLKIAIFEETKPLYENRPHVVQAWETEAYLVRPYEAQQNMPPEGAVASYRALFSFFTRTVFLDRPITKQMIREAVALYKNLIRTLLADHLIQEFPTDGLKHSINQDQIDAALQQEYILGSSEMEYHLMRDIVTKKDHFKENQTGNLTTEILDNRGMLKGLAELRPQDALPQHGGSDQQTMWLEMIGSTLNSLDEMTADLFDLITYLWMVSPKNEDGYIEFHSNDALRLRKLKKRSSQGKEMDFREEDRFNVMKRVAALSSIWVSMGDQKVQVLNTEDMEDSELYNFKDFQRMFEVGKIRVAYDKKSGEAKGIYAVQVKPAAILRPYIDGTNRSIGTLDLKVFQYSHYTQREHKRLTRYLNLQWKIRTIKGTLTQAFKISTLLKAMDVSNRYTQGKLRDKFEKVLDDLQQDGVIRQWEYTEPIEEERIGKRGWVKNYWMKLSVRIHPNELLIEENQNNLLGASNQITPNNLIVSQLFPKEQKAPREVAVAIEEHSAPMNEATYQQQAFDLSPGSEETQEEITLSPEILKERIDQLGISIRQVASEMGMSHSTLSRYLRKENKRQFKNNDKKMKAWLTKHT